MKFVALLWMLGLFTIVILIHKVTGESGSTSTVIAVYSFVVAAWCVISALWDALYLGRRRTIREPMMLVWLGFAALLVGFGVFVLQDLRGVVSNTGAFLMLFGGLTALVAAIPVGARDL